NVLWTLKKGFVKDVIAKWPEQPLPAYNTISTVIRILEDKGYIDHKAYGRTYEYFPKTTKSKYQKKALGSMIEQVFSGEMGSLVTALADHGNLSEEEKASLKKLIDAEAKQNP
ncbi:MAG: BlaI family penicillinase repressor, partial [Limisphaerales bacterium]